MLRLILFLITLLAPAFGQSATAFDVATIKLNTSGTMSMKFPVPSAGRFTVTNVNLKTLIAFAYGFGNNGIDGAPGWTNSDRYDVNAKAAESNLRRDQYQQMLQALLADRFKISVHHETRDLPVYSLLPAKTGIKLKPAEEGGCITVGPGSPPPPPAGPDQPSPIVCGTFFTGPFSLDGKKLTMATFANTLSIVLDRPVNDETGIAGTYDIHIEFSPEGVNLGQGPTSLTAEPANSDSGRPSIFTALQEQLGLRLDSKREPAEILVIDHIERVPVDN